MLTAARDTLRRQFGFDEFRPGQAEVVEKLLAGRSAAAVFPTGSGKSLCYQLPAVLLPGLTLVVSPLIALMKDQIDALRRRGIAAERLDSSLSADEFAQVVQGIRGGKLKLLYVAPERFNNERFRETIARAKVSLFAVDEAHCISEWGHSFRPDYLKLARFAKVCRAERLLALTATATPQVLADICREFAIDADCAVRTGFYRSNLKLLTTPVAAAERDALLARRLRERPKGPAIVYVSLQRTAESVAAQLTTAGFAAKAYHAGMDDPVRSETQEWFMASQAGIVVATIAFGMGVDKANIRYVYHYNLPKSLENCSQEIGRAGRDALPSTCEAFVCPDDLSTLENFAHGDTPSRESVQGFISDVFAPGRDFDLSTYECSARHDIRQLTVQTLLAYLELDGFLQAGTPFYSTFRFRPLVPSQEILARFEGERRDFLARIFQLAKRAQTWFDIDLEQAVESIGTTRERIVRALDYLGQERLLEVKVEGLRHMFRLLHTPPDLESLADMLHQRLLDREARDLERLGQVLELAGHDGCQVSRLGEHFGEPLAAPCGHCSWCLSGRRPARLLPRPAAQIADAVLRDAAVLAGKHPDPLRDPRALARLLCGLTSPRISAKRLGSEPLFGALSRVPFAIVLKRVAAAARLGAGA
jgi:ATP-dependent DNA helicase RecQ